MGRCVFVVAVLLFLAGAVPSAAQTGSRARVGILPVYDMSGEVHGETFSQYLTLMVFEELEEEAGVEPVLLNPGGLYTPDAQEWITEYAQPFALDGILISKLMPSNRPRKGDWHLRVETELLRMASHQRDAVQVYNAEVRKNDLKRGVEVGYSTDLSRVSPDHWGRVQYLYWPSRKFEKQPLGKIARRIAKAMGQRTAADAAQLPASGAPRPATSKQSCDVQFRITYTYGNRKASSKAYSVTVNDREESLGVRDGLVEFTEKSGPVQVRASLTDAPYKLPTQKVYTANTYLDCAQEERRLVLEIGPAGEAGLVWQ